MYGGSAGRSSTVIKRHQSSHFHSVSQFIYILFMFEKPNLIYLLKLVHFGAGSLSIKKLFENRL